MGFSFFKSKKILPGVRLNVSKGGLGISVGVKDARVSFGPKGTQVSASAGPLRFRQKISGTIKPPATIATDPTTTEQTETPQKNASIVSIWLLILAFSATLLLMKACYS